MNKLFAIKKRALRVRTRLRKVASDFALRVSVFRSNSHLYVQLIDDSAGMTLCSLSTLNKDFMSSLAIKRSEGVKKTSNSNKKGVERKSKTSSNIDVARKLGELFGQQIKKLCSDRPVVFDKGPYMYHGKVKAIADGVRSAGVKF